LHDESQKNHNDRIATEPNPADRYAPADFVVGQVENDEHA